MEGWSSGACVSEAWSTTYPEQLRNESWMLVFGEVEAVAKQPSCVLLTIKCHVFYMIGKAVLRSEVGLGVNGFLRINL